LISLSNDLNVDHSLYWAAFDIGTLTSFAKFLELGYRAFWGALQATKDSVVCIRDKSVGLKGFEVDWS